MVHVVQREKLAYEPSLAIIKKAIKFNNQQVFFENSILIVS